MSTLRKATGRGLLHGRPAEWAVPLGLCTRAGSKTLTPRTAKHREPGHEPPHIIPQPTSQSMVAMSAPLSISGKRVVPNFQENFSRPPSALQCAVLVNTLCGWEGSCPSTRPACAGQGANTVSKDIIEPWGALAPKHTHTKQPRPLPYAYPGGRALHFPYRPASPGVDRS